MLQKLVPAIVDFAKSVKKLKRSLSPKAAVTATHAKLAQALKNELASYGIHFNVATFARGVGVTATSAAYRPTRLVKQRFNRTRKELPKLIS